MDFSNMHFYKQMSALSMHSISLPKKLTRQLAHLAGKVLELQRPSGGTWYVGLMMSGDKLVLQPGWNDFAIANKLSQNDHLVFKFIAESKFEVYIFDPTGCEKGASFENKQKEQDWSLCSIVGEEWSKELHKFDMIEEGAETSNDSVPISMLFRTHSQQNKHHSEIRSETKTPPSKRHHQNPSNIPSGNGKERKTFQSCYNNYSSKIQLTGEQKKRAEQLSCKVHASNPYFQTLLKKGHVTTPCRIRFPLEFSAAHLQKETLEVLYCPEQGKTWLVMSYFFASGPVQMLQGSTLEKFIEENKLREGILTQNDLHLLYTSPERQAYWTLSVLCHFVCVRKLN